MVNRSLLLAATLPGLVLNRNRRALCLEMRQLNQRLPTILSESFQDAMLSLTHEIGRSRPDSKTEEMIRNLADLVVVLDRTSPLGLCLRRSITRCHFLRRAGLPIVIHFGARPDNVQEQVGMLGHAWLTLEGKPYFESRETWRDFITMISFPDR